MTGSLSLASPVFALAGGPEPAEPPMAMARSTAPRREPPAPRPAPALFKAASAKLDEHLVTFLRPGSFEAEQYRTLRHVLEHRRRTAGMQVVAVSSPGISEGKTTTSTNLAGSLARAREMRVLLIDADLRRPAVSPMLGLDGAGGRGLAGAIADENLPLDAAMARLEAFNLSVLPAGAIPDSPYELLESRRLGAILQEARGRFDHVIVDCPPLLAVPDCRLIERWIDGFLLVVSANATPRKLLEEALAILDPPKVIGMVFNNDPRPLSGYYGYYGRYYAHTR